MLIAYAVLFAIALAWGARGVSLMKMLNGMWAKWLAVSAIMASASAISLLDFGYAVNWLDAVVIAVGLVCVAVVLTVTPYALARVVGAVMNA